MKFPISLVLACLVSSAALAETLIRPVTSWADYRDLLIEEGRSETEADTEMKEALVSLKELDRSAGADLIGSAAPPFRFDGWFNSKALTLKELRGRVVLVRWWTDTCPYCASSAPALRSLHEAYADKGLSLIGVFHPKAGRDDPLDMARVQRAVEVRQFVFPVAVDWDWRKGTLKDWWHTGPERPATSVTFILDKTGVIRFIHPGMEYHDDNGSSEHGMCMDDMGRIRRMIEQLLAE
jgi:thiol-disulfide isomerase/thioredoxin